MSVCVVLCCNIADWEGCMFGNSEYWWIHSCWLYNSAVNHSSICFQGFLL